MKVTNNKGNSTPKQTKKLIRNMWNLIPEQKTQNNRELFLQRNSISRKQAEKMKQIKIVHLHVWYSNFWKYIYFNNPLTHFHHKTTTFKHYRGTKLSASNISAALNAHGYQGIPSSANTPVTYSQQHHQKYQQPQQQQQQQYQQPQQQYHQPQHQQYPPQPKVSASFVVQLAYFI